MKIEEAIFSYLSTYAGLIALINKKIYPHVIPQNVEMPAIVYEKVSGNMMRSAVDGNYGLTSPVYQITCYSKTYSELKNIVAQVKAALNNYQGTTGGIEIQGCFLIAEIDDYEPEEGIQLYKTIMDFEFYFNE